MDFLNDFPDLQVDSIHETPLSHASYDINTSSPSLESPTSSSMSRKRTLQDMSNASSIFDIQLDDSMASSPHSSIPSFEFEPALHPSFDCSSFSASLASSPISFSNSPQTSWGIFGPISDASPSECDDAYLAPRGRPEIKRRRTAPDIMSPSTPTRSERDSPSSDSRRGNGKDGQDVWPTDIEDAFHAALLIIPKLGRKKVIVHGKPCGRNELIADYIYRKTGQTRTRKQVSSHIQVLKNMRKNDQEFMNLVSEPLEGEDTFAPGAALAFFGVDSPEILSYTRSDSLSPYPSAFLQRSMSMGAGSPLHHSPISPALSDSLSLSSPYPTSAPMSAASSLTSAMKDMHFPMPPPQERLSPACPIAPASFTLWADEVATDSTHIFVEMPLGTGVPSGSVSLDELQTPDREYPGLANMFDHLPCQFLHVKLNLDIPSGDTSNLATQLHTQLQISSVQDLSLASVTRIYSFGHEVLTLSENLDKPSRISPPSRAQISSASSSPASPISPMTPGAHKGSPSNPLRHKYTYNAPFVADFWSIFLRGAFSSEGNNMLPSFAKNGDERTAFIMALSGLSVIQEFVVLADGPSSPPLTHGKDVSPGSALGDVVLVVTYDFECRENVPTHGKARMSFLTSKPLPTAAVPFVAAPAMPPTSSPAPAIRLDNRALSKTRSVPPARRGGGDMSRSHSAGPTLMASSMASAPIPAPAVHRPSLSPVKPGLSLLIPPHPDFSSMNAPAQSQSGHSTPITPWPQMIHTPNAPPPVMPVGTTPHVRDHRLERIWARDSSEWGLASPALLGALSDDAGRGFPGLRPPVEVSTPVSSLPGGGLKRNVRSHGHRRTVSQAMNEMTTSAMAAGTPTLECFPPNVTTSHGTPFVVHPSHGYTDVQEDVFAAALAASASPPLESSGASPESTRLGSPKKIVDRQGRDVGGPDVLVFDVDEAEKREEGDEVEATTEGVKQIDIQDYFSSLLGSTTRYAGAESKATISSPARR